MHSIRYASNSLTIRLRKALRKSSVVFFLGMVISLMACTSAETTSTAEDIQGKISNLNSFDKNQKVAALNRLAELLEDLYVFPDKGEMYATYLRQLTSKLSQSDKEHFANLITAGLNNIHKDAHLRVEVESEHHSDAGPDNSRPDRIFTPPPKSLVQIFYPTAEIAYLRFDTLWGDPETMAELHELVDKSDNITTIIIDLRKNRGGGLAEIDFFASELFSDPTELLIMEVRRTIYEMEGGPFREGPTLQRIEGPAASVRLLHKVIPSDSPQLTDTKVYILTSPLTASAAEHFALAMQRTGRAILVGESTKGAAHFGGLMPIGSGLRAFIPAGRTYNPDTGDSWEGVGVQPDLKITSDEALLITLKDIGLNVKHAAEINNMVTANPL